MENIDNNIVHMKFLRKQYLDKSEEFIIKSLESDNQYDYLKYMQESYKYLGRAEGLSIAIKLYQYTK